MQNTHKILVFALVSLWISGLIPDAIYPMRAHKKWVRNNRGRLVSQDIPVPETFSPEALEHILTNNQTFLNKFALAKSRYWLTFLNRSKIEETDRIPYSRFFHWTIPAWIAYPSEWTKMTKKSQVPFDLGFVRREQILKQSATIDPEHNIYPHNIFPDNYPKNPFLPDNKKYYYRYAKPYDQWENQDFKKLKQEALCAMGCRWKIHLQVAPKYLIPFMRDFVNLIQDAQWSKNICTFKVVTRYFPSNFKTTGNAIPIIVLYVQPFFSIPGPTGLKKRKQILDPIITALVNRYAHITSPIALRDQSNRLIRPRWNHKINDLIYIAGGDGDQKKAYLEFLDRYNQAHPDKKAPNTVFTPDFAFISGYEYRFAPKQ